MFGIIAHVVMKTEKSQKVLWMIQLLFVMKLYDENIKTIPTNFNVKKVTCKTKSFYILLTFLSITIALSIAVSIYCYLIKYQAKKLLPFHDTKNELNKFCIDSIN